MQSQLEAVEGVKDVSVDFPHKTATITFTEPATAEVLAAVEQGVKGNFKITGLHGHKH